eukprot:TRINITY_DN62767_c0_g1_i1.p1 TRINITY_DN62767_c0_g1~~TRINITY_DN62767_c0_g1_i1.p1  ORF type:complete len:558 (-),score=84.63 TRINITY_DN62767_c0_g1_i1:219-1892(-)
MTALQFAACFVAMFGVDVASATAMSFLGSRDHRLSVGQRNSDLLQEIEITAGRNYRVATEDRALRIEEAIKPMFSAMPKDLGGRLDSTGVRYLLHRHFVQRHGWIVRGLENGGLPWNATSPAAVFKDHAVEHHDLFDAKLRTQGFSLHQVAVFAATLETLVHDESRSRLEDAYSLLGLVQSESNLSEKEIADAVRAYMLMYVQAPVFTNVTKENFQNTLLEASELYPGWPETDMFASGVRRVVLESIPDNEHRSWNTTLKVVEEIGERYGRWQDKECRELKQLLIQMEESGTGRVRLDKFYGSVLNSDTWQFMESLPYLRQLGALDETDPKRIHVIIPNYMNSPTNCLASSKFYDVCCIDECEALLGALEVTIAAPDAEPSQIVSLVSSLPSDTVQAPRFLTEELTRRLEDIATHHGGRVPLHGRLFAQWMHHAYPRECSFPHVSGTTKPVTQEGWMEQTDEPLMASMDEIQRLVDESRELPSGPLVAGETQLPWSVEEELFVCRPGVPDANPSAHGGYSWMVMLLSVLTSAVLIAWRPNKKKMFLGDDMSRHKYFV